MATVTVRWACAPGFLACAEAAVRGTTSANVSRAYLIMWSSLELGVPGRAQGVLGGYFDRGYDHVLWSTRRGISPFEDTRALAIISPIHHLPLPNRIHVAKEYLTFPTSC